MTAQRRFAYFITPHGYGHATRACAVMLALRRASPGVFFEIYTRVPLWVFSASLGDGFNYHELFTDVGLIQDSVMDENLPETVRRLGEIYPFDADLVRRLAGDLKASGCEVVLCDVAAMGIAAARAAGLPSILIENFTWDWIYEGYLDAEPRLKPYIDLLREAYASADFHIRTEPSCSDAYKADLVTSVVGRHPRTPASEIRKRLGIPNGKPVILVTMGGIGSQYPFLKKLENSADAYFMIPGSGDRLEKRGSLVTLAHHSEFYHPDLVGAADAVVGKLGYSTLAETYLNGLPFAYIPRPRFRESDVMSQFVVEHMNGIELLEDRFYAGGWLDLVPQLLAISRRPSAAPDGGDQAAAFILSR
jgi:UDP:flavonoid glycosyltransferase YjiC (YdhE family)